MRITPIRIVLGSLLLAALIYSAVSVTEPRSAMGQTCPPSGSTRSAIVVLQPTYAYWDDGSIAWVAQPLECYLMFWSGSGWVFAVWDGYPLDASYGVWFEDNSSIARRSPALAGSGVLTGFVYWGSSAANRVSGASVTLTHPDGHQTPGNTNSSGVYRFGSLPSGSYSISVSASGACAAPEISVSVASGRTVTRNVPMNSCAPSTPTPRR